MAAVLCDLYNTLMTDFLQPLAFIGAVLGIVWFGVSYTLSGVFPEMVGKMRQVPKNIILGLLAVTVGPGVITGLASTLGLGFSC